MNEGAFNGFAINETILDVSVRAYVQAYAYALAQPNGTVLRRWSEALDARARADAVVVARAMLRQVGAFSASANATVGAKRQARMALAAYAYAEAVVVPHALGRVIHSEAVLSSALANAIVIGRVMARSPSDWSALAQADIRSRAMRRAPLSGTAEAAGYVDASSYIQYPFDENASEENTYVVPPEPTLFYVADGMTLIATITQQPRDIKDRDIDFSEYFPAGDVVTAVEISVTPVGLTVGYALQHPRVKVWTQGGVDGTKYKVTILASTNDGRAKEVEMIVKVKDN